MDFKIVIFAVGCALGYWSHFVVKFPDEAHLLIVALVSYVALMFGHYLIESIVERDAFYIAKSHNYGALAPY